MNQDEDYENNDNDADAADYPDRDKNTI